MKLPQALSILNLWISSPPLDVVHLILKFDKGGHQRHVGRMGTIKPEERNAVNLVGEEQAERGISQCHGKAPDGGEDIQSIPYLLSLMNRTVLVRFGAPS